MATQPLGHDSRAVTLPDMMPAVAHVLARFDRDQLGNAIEIMVALLDIRDGDPDAENATDAEDDFALSPSPRWAWT